ncbi:MAG: beta-hexosaminidase [Eubacterium sp.]|nr:beta-hexosaminidase [Eubacterium sp.]
MKKSIKSFASLVLALVIALTMSFSITAVAYAKEKEKIAQSERIEEILKSMTLSEKIGQMMLVYVPKSKAYETQKKRQYGGYVIFANSFKNSTKGKIKKRISVWQKTSKVKMLISVDEEGGSVVRASKYKQFRKYPYMSPRRVYQKGGWEKVKSDAKSKSKFLLSLNINTNLAPVADVAYKRSNFIFSRSFSTNANAVSKYIRLSVTEMNNKKCISTLKHFPGYGNNGDTHTGVVVDYRSKKVFENRDLKPFKAGIKAGAPMIMVSHNIVRCFDKRHPASMSYKVHKYLREEMNFDGVIVTDGLGMKGVINKYGSYEEVAVRAVKAGNDMLCTPHGVRGIRAIRKAVKKGEIKESQIDKSVRRILKMKLDYGIIR